MKKIKSFMIVLLAIMYTFSLSAQTAEEIIEKSLKAMGGKEFLSDITSLYTEGDIDVMGMIGTIKTTTLNGKGMRQDMDIMGSIISTCYTDSAGWSMNPMMGSYAAETMPEQQYNSGKDQIYIEGYLLDYAQDGFNAEYLGTETVSGVDAHKVKITKPDSTSALYYFDPNTFFLIYSIQQAEMQGMIVDNAMTFSDYKEVDGYTLAHKISLDMAGGQFYMTITFKKVELNIPVDETIFDKPL